MQTVLINTYFWPTFTLNIDPVSLQKASVKATLRLAETSLDSHFLQWLKVNKGL